MRGAHPDLALGGGQPPRLGVVAQRVEERVVVRVELLDGHDVRAVGHRALPPQHVDRELVRGVRDEELPRFDQRVVYRIGPVLRVPVLDEEVVHGLGDFCCSVKPSDHHNKCIPLTLLKLGDVANVEGLIRSLALDENIITNFVFNVVYVLYYSSFVFSLWNFGI